MWSSSVLGAEKELSKLMERDALNQESVLAKQEIGLTHGEYPENTERRIADGIS